MPYFSLQLRAASHAPVGVWVCGCAGLCVKACLVSTAVALHTGGDTSPIALAFGMSEQQG
jgi:hypothetical protein